MTKTKKNSAMNKKPYFRYYVIAKLVVVYRLCTVTIHMYFSLKLIVSFLYELSLL